jgi:hypothetical protein
MLKSLSIFSDKYGRYELAARNIAFNRQASVAVGGAAQGLTNWDAMAGLIY